MGTKYIIEVEDKPFELLSEDGFTSEKLFRVKGFNSLVFDWNGLNMLTPYTEPDLERVKKEAYDKGYHDGYFVGDESWKDIVHEKEEEFYQKGLSDAWEAARKILFNPDDGGMSAIDVNEVFGESSWTVMKDFSASEVVAKIKEYEDSKQKIKVGDEVEDGVANLVVLEINEDGTVEGFTDYGSVVHAIPRKKTGRYFPEVVALLKNMKGK